MSKEEERKAHRQNVIIRDHSVLTYTQKDNFNSENNFCHFFPNHCVKKYDDSTQLCKKSSEVADQQ
jgi:hypothetical protein